MAFGDMIQTAVANGISTTVQATFGSAVTTGNLIVAVAFSGDGPLTVAGTLAEDINHHDTGQDDGFSIGHRVVQGGDGTTWGFTAPGADQFAIILREYEGPWEASPLDQTGTAAFADLVNTQQVTAGGTTSQNDELVVAAWGFRAMASDFTDTPTSVDNSFADLLNEINLPGALQKGVGTARKVLTATGTPTVTATFSGGSGFSCGRSGALIATYKKGAAVSTTPLGLLMPPRIAP